MGMGQEEEKVGWQKVRKIEKKKKKKREGYLCFCFFPRASGEGFLPFHKEKKRKKKFHCCVVLLLGFSEYILYQSSFFQIFFFPFSLIFKFFFSLYQS